LTVRAADGDERHGPFLPKGDYEDEAQCDINLSLSPLLKHYPSAYGGVAPRWEAPDCPPFQRVLQLPAADPRGSTVVYSGLCEDVQPPGGARAPVRHGPEQGQSVDPRPAPCVPGDPAHPRGCPRPFPERPSAAAWGLGGRRRDRGRPAGEGSSA